MYCQNCGHQIPDGARYCPDCGAPQSTPTINQIPISHPSPGTGRYPECYLLDGNIADRKCKTCGHEFCVKHIARFFGGWYCKNDAIRQKNRLSNGIRISIFSIAIAAGIMLFGGLVLDSSLITYGIGGIALVVSIVLFFALWISLSAWKSFIKRGFPD